MPLACQETAYVDLSIFVFPPTEKTSKNVSFISIYLSFRISLIYVCVCGYLSVYCLVYCDCICLCIYLYQVFNTISLFENVHLHCNPSSHLAFNGRMKLHALYNFVCEGTTSVLGRISQRILIRIGLFKHVVHRQVVKARNNPRICLGDLEKGMNPFKRIF